jgi:PAS domain S-box-containing protein
LEPPRIYEAAGEVFFDSQKEVRMAGRRSEENPQGPGKDKVSRTIPSDDAPPKSNPDFLTLAVNVPGMVYRVFIKEKNRMQFFNDMLEKMTGYRADELTLGEVCSIDPAIIPEDRPRVVSIVKDAVSENKPFEVEYRLKHKDGVIRHFLERGQPVGGRDGNPEFIDGLILDITERKRIEEAQRESEERFRSVLESSLDAAYRRNLKTNQFDYVSPVFEQIIGFTPDEMAAMGIDGVLQRVHPDDRHQLEQGVERISKEGRGLLEYRFRAKDGEYRWLAATLSVVKDKEGCPLHRIGVVRDITPSKQAEEAIIKAREELEIRVRERTSELERRNEELREFALVVSHDLREPLRKIQAFAGLIRRRHSHQLADEFSDYLFRMEAAANRVERLLEALLSYSRITTKGRSFKPVDLNDVVQEAVSDLELAIQKARACLEISSLPTVNGDREQLRQVFQNLISNAIKFHPREAKPVVKIHGCKSTIGIQVFVEDNGIGFEENQLKRILRPFQRLHGRKEYEGIGMGLAICKKIIADHGGEIGAKSAKGKGSTFIVTLPLR